MARVKRKPKAKRAPKTDRACLCHPVKKPTFPIISHAITCPVRRRFTDNGRMIAELMHSKRIKGSPKDYVIVVGQRLIDYRGTYDIRGLEARHGFAGVNLVHKRELERFVGSEQSRRFWRRGVGRVHANS
jgi:hypothetical protein